MANDDLIEFVESRLPLIKYALETVFDGKHLGNNEKNYGNRRGSNLYAAKQAFFYHAEWYLDKKPLVSEGALEYVKSHPGMYGKDPNVIFSMRRPDLPGVERAGFLKSGLIYEHIYTGGMFWRELQRLHGLDQLSAAAVADVLQENFLTAWITRKTKAVDGRPGTKGENSRLPSSKRGKDLSDALMFYAACGIKVFESPGNEFKRPDPDPHRWLDLQFKVARGTLPREVAAFVKQRADDGEVLQQVVGAPKGKRSNRILTDGFIPSSWKGLAAMPHPAQAGHWSTGLPLVFWFTQFKGGVELIAEVGPWHESDVRESVIHQINELGWTGNRKKIGKKFRRFWSAKGYKFSNMELNDIMLDLWAEMAEFLPGIEEILRHKNLLPASAK